MIEGNLLIGGIWAQADDGKRTEIRNPADGSVAGSVPAAGQAEAVRAVDAAAAAFPVWSSMTAYERSAIMVRWHQYVLDHLEPIATVLTSEQGKPLAEARQEVRYGASYIMWYAEEAKRLYGETVPSSQANKRILLSRQPVGVVAAVTPWNFPCAMITRKLAPAIASGCTVVAKPAGQTPLTAYLLVKGLTEAGLPPGVVNLVTGRASAIVDPWLQDGRVRKLTFTGSTETGKMLMRKSADTMKKLSLELGGHAPAIVFADADLPAAVEEIVRSKFRNAGQTCVCINRVYVQREIYEAFIAAMSASLAGLRVGDGRQPDTQIGPIVDAAAFRKVEEHVRDALGKGASLVCGGSRKLRAADEYGNFYSPTLLAGTDERMLVMREETFGPVLAVAPFDTEEEAIRRANDTPYGLAAYLFTENASRGCRVAEALQFGIVGWNDGAPSTAEAPFGGFKESGFGREGGKAGIEEFLEWKYISFRLQTNLAGHDGRGGA